MRVALVTGASRNIGRAIAEDLATHGWHVAVNSRDPELVDRVVAGIRAGGGSASAAVADITDPDAVSRVVAHIESEHGPISCLVSSVGCRAHGLVEDHSLDDWNHVMTTVLTGAFLVSRHVAPGMRDRRHGRIITIAGATGQTGAPQRTALVAAKAGLIGLTKALAHELAPFGVTANSVSPGPIDTGRRAELGDAEAAEATYRDAAASVPMGRLGTVAEVASACSFLASDEAAFVTGQVLGVNGGRVM